MPVELAFTEKLFVGSQSAGTSVALKEMSTVLDAEREALELETIPEYLSDSQLPSREVAVSMASQAFHEREARTPAPEPVVQHQHTHRADELETLWPGLGHEEFVPPTRKSPTFYMTVGFMGGAVLSMIGVVAFLGAGSLMSHNGSAEKHITMAGGAGKAAPNTVPAPTVRSGDNGGESVSPSAPTYQVATGDTLAGIALKNYKRVSPRLLDEICKANNLRNANVLSLGQKLTLPEYHTQTAQIAGAGQIQ